MPNPKCAAFSASTGVRCGRYAMNDCLFCHSHNTNIEIEEADPVLPPPPAGITDAPMRDNYDQARDDMKIILDLQKENLNLQRMVRELTSQLNQTTRYDKKCVYRAKLMFYHDNKENPLIDEHFRPGLTSLGFEFIKIPWQLVFGLCKKQFELLSNDAKNVYYQKAQVYILNKVK